jgi:hypothetical protein
VEKVASLPISFYCNNFIAMGGNKSGIIHNQTDEYVYYTLHSIDKVPQALVTKMSFGVKAGANLGQGLNAGGLLFMQAARASIRASSRRNSQQRTVSAYCHPVASGRQVSRS